MEAICSSEMSVETQRTTRRHIPEDDTLHNHHCENLKSNKVLFMLTKKKKKWVDPWQYSNLVTEKIIFLSILTGSFCYWYISNVCMCAGYFRPFRHSVLAPDSTGGTGIGTRAALQHVRPVLVLSGLSVSVFSIPDIRRGGCRICHWPRVAFPSFLNCCEFDHRGHECQTPMFMSVCVRRRVSDCTKEEELAVQEIYCPHLGLLLKYFREIESCRKFDRVR
jgi:hypothetical protein